jgi:hypothetical protein
MIMTKLTHYTSFDDLKASKSSIAAERPQSSQQAELKEFIALLKDHCSLPPSSGSNKSVNPSERGQ